MQTKTRVSEYLKPSNVNYLVDIDCQVSHIAKDFL